MEQRFKYNILFNMILRGLIYFSSFFIGFFRPQSSLHFSKNSRFQKVPPFSVAVVEKNSRRLSNFKKKTDLVLTDSCLQRENKQDMQVLTRKKMERKGPIAMASLKRIKTKCRRGSFSSRLFSSPQLISIRD